MAIAQTRVPFVFVEFDPTAAFSGPSILKYKVLVFGQHLSGSKPSLQVDLVNNKDQAIDFYGAGSQLARMLEKYFQNNPSTETYVVAMDDDGGSAKASGDITFGGTATKAGTIFIYVGGERFTIPVAVGDTSIVVATNAFNEINLEPNVATAATNGTPSETALEAKNGGEAGNEIDLRLNYNVGEELPEGITAVVTAISGGTANPDAQDVIDILGDEWYNVWIAAYTDAANLTAIETELAIRFGPTKQIDAVYFSSKRDILANLVTFGTGRNSPHVSVIYGTGIPNTAEEIAAAYGGQVALEAQIDPARPFQTLGLSGILSPNSTDRFDMAESDILLNSGIATFQTDSGGVVRIQRAITMYQKNAQNAPDIAFLDLNTMFTLMFLRFDFRTQILTKYPRAKLADDGNLLPAGQQILTPKGGKAEAVSIFRGWESLGLVENADAFKAALIVERDNSDPNRLNWFLQPDLINQFRVGAASIQFLLAQPQ